MAVMRGPISFRSFNRQQRRPDTATTTIPTHPHPHPWPHRPRSQRPHHLPKRLPQRPRALTPTGSGVAAPRASEGLYPHVRKEDICVSRAIPLGVSWVCGLAGTNASFIFVVFIIVVGSGVGV